MSIPELIAEPEPRSLTNQNLILQELGSFAPFRHSLNPPVTDFKSAVPATEIMGYLQVWQSQTVVTVVINDGYATDGVQYAWELTEFGYIYGQQLGVYPIPPAPLVAAAGLPEAPKDGQLYGRENASWVVVPAPSAGPPVTPSSLISADANNQVRLGSDNLLFDKPAYYYVKTGQTFPDPNSLVWTCGAAGDSFKLAMGAVVFLDPGAQTLPVQPARVSYMNVSGTGSRPVVNIFGKPIGGAVSSAQAKTSYSFVYPTNVMGLFFDGTNWRVFTPMELCLSNFTQQTIAFDIDCSGFAKVRLLVGAATVGFNFRNVMNETSLEINILTASTALAYGPIQVFPLGQTTALTNAQHFFQTGNAMTGVTLTPINPTDTWTVPVGSRVYLTGNLWFQSANGDRLIWR